MDWNHQLVVYIAVYWISTHFLGDSLPTKTRPFCSTPGLKNLLESGILGKLQLERDNLVFFGGWGGAETIRFRFGGNYSPEASSFLDLKCYIKGGHTKKPLKSSGPKIELMGNMQQQARVFCKLGSFCECKVGHFVYGATKSEIFALRDIPRSPEVLEVQPVGIWVSKRVEYGDFTWIDSDRYYEGWSGSGLKEVGFVEVWQRWASKFSGVYLFRMIKTWTASM